jgi:hypothetical protein
MAKNEKAAPPATDAAPAFKFRVARRVVVPTLKLASGVAVFVKFLDTIQTKDKQEKNDKGEVETKTIDIARVVNLETGEETEFVVGTVLKSDLDEAYPSGGYKEKCFRVMKKDVAGKRYKSYELDEIEVG